MAAFGQEDFFDEENRFRDTVAVETSEVVVSSHWPTGFCGSVSVTNPVEPAAVWSAVLLVRTETFKIIGDVWGDSTKLLTSNSTDSVGTSSSLVPTEDREVILVDSPMVLNLCMGVDTKFLVEGQEFSDYLPELMVTLKANFT